MAKISKKTLAIVLTVAGVAAAALVVSLLFVFGVFAQNKVNFEFRKVEGGYEVVSYTGDSKSIAIPSSYKKEPVVGIAENAFYSETKYKDIVEVKLPRSLKYVSKNAFAGMTSLKTVFVPANVESIGENALLGDSALEKFELEENSQLVHFGKNALFGTKIMKNFDEIASNDKILEVSGVLVLAKVRQNQNIEISNDVLIVADSAFLNCARLESVSCEQNSLLVAIDDNAFLGCKNLVTADFENAKNLRIVGDSAFEGTLHLSDVHFADALESIGNKAFWESSVSSADFGKGSIVFGSNVFSANAVVSRIRLSADSQNVGALIERLVKNISSFELCISGGSLDKDFAAQVGDKAKKLVIENGAHLEGNGMNSFVALNEFEIPAKVLSEFENVGVVAKDSSYKLVITGNGEEDDKLEFLCGGVFDYATTLEIKGVTCVCDKAFAGLLRLVSVEYDDKLESCGYCAFEGTPWLAAKKAENGIVTCGDMLLVAKGSGSTVVEIPEGVKKLDRDSLLARNVCLPLSLEEIGEKAFENGPTNISICFKLDKNGLCKVKKIGDFAFWNASLASFSTIMQKDDGTFEANGSSLVFSEIESAGEKIVRYNANSGLVTFGTTILVGGGSNAEVNGVLKVPSGVRVVAKKAFADTDSSVLRIVLSSSVTLVCENAFSGFVNAREIDVSASTAKIESNAFASVADGQVVFRGNEVFDISNIFVAFSGQIFVKTDLVDEYLQQNLGDVSIAVLK